jgi:hypothetical protein
MKKLALMMALLAFTGMAQAKPAFTGQNYSGVYSCRGVNEQVGDYELSVTLKLNRVSSYGSFGAYSYEVETSNSTIYTGQAAADGNRLAISFQFTDGHTIEQSTGVALMKKNPDGRWSFRKLYYEPDDNGGNYGSEYCVMNINKGAKKVAWNSKSVLKARTVGLVLVGDGLISG